MTPERSTSAHRRAGEGTSPRPDPDAPVQYVKGVGPARAALLGELGITTVRDLLLHLPRRYEDRSHPAPLARLEEGQEKTVLVRVDHAEVVRTRKGTVLVRAGLIDATGAAHAIWFNQPYLAQRLSRGTRLCLHGRVERAGRGLQFVSPEMELLRDGEEFLHVNRIVPVYPATEGLAQRSLRSIIWNALDRYSASMPEVLPQAIRERMRLPRLTDALRSVHFPSEAGAQVGARRRLAFEELFVLQLGVLLQRREADQTPRGAFYGPWDALVERFVQSLPFPLTRAQRRIIGQILEDMRGPVPMNRLLHGDVGSGKTVVAAAALVASVGGGYQAALMAPTEILAEQHRLTLERLLARVRIPVFTLTGGGDASTRAAALAAATSGEPCLTVGTHALLEDRVAFSRLGLVVIDEQHRFGVVQRSRLREKGPAPDVLVMTATPIPRTLALTVYGDLDLSALDEMPPGRSPVATLVRGASARPAIYRFAREQVGAGRQVFVVCPTIDEAEAGPARSALEVARELSEGPLAGLSLEVVHGRLAAAQRAERMEAFRAGSVDVLVATTVIEVGIDVPNATVMIVEDADRYGLAQLHQLRGRVGRGAERSYCVLIADPRTEEGRQRLEVMRSTSDGYVIAQQDLVLRGPGDVLGVRQHGIAGLRVADIIADAPLLEEARAEAEALLQHDPKLASDELRQVRLAVDRQMEHRGSLASVG